MTQSQLLSPSEDLATTRSRSPYHLRDSRSGWPAFVEYPTRSVISRGTLDETGTYLVIPTDDEAVLTSELAAWQGAAAAAFFAFEDSLPN